MYDISRFKNLHPGGASVLLDPEVGECCAIALLALQLRAITAGQDATESFFSLHRVEVLERQQYQRLQIGTVQGEESVIRGRVIGEISKVPYAEPTWLQEGYHSPYYSEVSN